MPMNWTPDKIDAVLEKLLPCDSKRSYELACKRLADEYGCGESDVRIADQRVRDGDPVNRLLWGVCLRVRDYRPTPAEPDSGRRGGRTGPLTWVERRCLDWAVNGSSAQQKAKPNAKYMAELLQRPESVVKEAIYKLGPARGRTGFFSSRTG
jgi:hypothetical protein